MHLSLYLLIPYSQASDHSVNVGVVNRMLFIGNTVSVTHWRIFIKSCRSCICQDWSCCGPHFFPLLEGCGVNSGSTSLMLWYKLHAWAYQWGIIACLYLFLLTQGMDWYCIPMLSSFIAEGIPVDNRSRCPRPDRSCVRKSGLLPKACGVRGGHIVSGVCRTSEVWIWCGWSMRLRSWRATPSMGTQW